MSSFTQSFQRRLPLAGAFNVRDLGGYDTADGRNIRWGRFFRADGLHRLTPEDQHILLELGLRTVIDLRHEHELNQHRNVFFGSDQVDYHNISLVNPATSTRRDIRSLGDLYIDMLDNVQPELLRVFQLLAAGDDRSVLFHCAAGKDRTGVTAALLLDFAGVSAETIVEDYALTGECIAPIMDQLRSDKPEGVSEESYEIFLASDPANMVMMLEHLHSKYGGAESYLNSIGLTGQELISLRSKLIDE